MMHSNNENDSFLPDFLDDPLTVLPSFSSIRKRTHDTLYAFGVDKSPKGSVDAPIRDLVDLINKHPSFATLSSCSGRIAVFAPVRAETTEFDTADHDDRAAQIDQLDSGKGSGGWLFVSHDPVEMNDMEQVFQGSDTNHDDGHKQPCTFRLEPMLLHVAAANLERGRQLMKLVLGLGFRESGMVVTPSRVTVAVRSYSLAMTMPMASSGPWKLPEPYWRSLVAEANNKLRENTSRIKGLYEEVEATLFQARQPIYVQPLPDLNLWGHAAVAVSGEHKGKDITDVLVIGGYGSGPSLVSDKNDSAPSRSDKVYRLRRHGFQWHNHWELMHSMDDTYMLDDAETSIIGLVSQQTPWGEREFAAACVLPVDPVVLCIFGGRTSPTRPLDDLLLCEYNYSSYAIAKRPIDVRGERPASRWGHTLCALSGGTDQLAVLVGGRDNVSTFASIHVLSMLQPDDNESAHLLWETIFTPLFDTPRFHHSAVALDDQVLVFGGRSDANNLLETFTKGEQKKLDSYLFNAMDGKEDTFLTINGVSSHAYGHSAVLLGDATRRSLVVCGGLSAGTFQQTAVMIFELKTTVEGVDAYCRPNRLISKSRIDFGSMVHHVSLPVCSSGPILEIVSVGGGVHGFGFQQTYAKSHMLTIDLSEGALDVAHLTPIIIKKRLDSKSLQCPSISPVESQRSDASEPGLSDVLLVKKKDAKQAKTYLAACSFLDLTYRMSNSSADDEMIAVPVTQKCLAALDSDQDLEWRELVQGRSKQVLAYRSGTFARHG